MIKITMNDGTWKIAITDEVWEFPTFTIFKKVLGQLTEFKEVYGKLKEN